MEGVGARLGRSSTRYGPATVFTGPVRKWKKKWIHVTPPHGGAAAAATSNNHHNHHQHHQANGNSASNGNSSNNNNASHIMLYRWTPISQSHNAAGNNNGSNGDAKDDGAGSGAEEEPPRRKMKYIPVAVLEQNNDASEEQIGDEVKATETDPDAAGEPTSKSDHVDEKPDINNVPMEESQVPEDPPVKRQDLNESTSDLSLNLNDCDGDDDDDEDPEAAKDESRAVG